MSTNVVPIKSDILETDRWTENVMGSISQGYIKTILGPSRTVSDRHGPSQTVTGHHGPLQIDCHVHTASYLLYK